MQGHSASETDPADDASAVFDLDRVIPWLRAHVEWLTEPLRWEKLEGGHSNFTFRVRDGNGATIVLRRPPLGELLPSAHDMAREFTIMKALWTTGVPVPEPLALCEDTSVTGAVFYAMRSVQGVSLYNAEQALATVPQDRRRAHGFQFIDVLADLHAIDPTEVGLGRLGRPDGYIERQLRRWKASWDASMTCERPDVERLHDFLADNVPPQGPARIAHGDYGLHNVLSTTEGRVAAVIDWEVATLGDPLADLAYSINLWGKRGEQSRRGPKPSLVPGYPTDGELLERYATRTGVDLRDLDFYVAFNYWKSVCIVDGVLARYANGGKSSVGVDMDGLRYGRDESLEKAIDVGSSIGYRRA